MIDAPISNRLKEIFKKIAPAYNLTLEEWNHDMEHVHILFRGQPNTAISKFINVYKSVSSRIIKFAKTFGCCRKIYNLMLSDKIASYKTTGKFITVTTAKYKIAYGIIRWTL